MCLPGDPEAPQDQQCKKHHNANRTHEAQFLAGNGKDIVVILKRQIEVFLSAFAKPKAKQASGANGIERLQNLIPRVSGVQLRVPPGSHPVAGVAHQAGIHQQKRRRPQRPQQQPLGMGSGNVHHEDGHHAHKHNGAQVLFQGQWHQDAQQRPAEAQDPPAEKPGLFSKILGQPGKQHDHSKLCHL